MTKLLDSVEAKILQREAHVELPDMVSVNLSQTKETGIDRPYLECVRVRAEVRLFGEFIARNNPQEIEYGKQKIVREIAHLAYGDTTRALLEWYVELKSQIYLPQELDTKFSKIVDSMH